MKRISIAIVILVVTVAAWNLENYALKSISGKLIAQLDKVSAALEAGKYSDTAQYIDDFCAMWSENEGLIAILRPHDEADDVSRNAAIMKTYSIPDSKNDAISCVAETKEILDEIRRKNLVNSMNIF